MKIKNALFHLNGSIDTALSDSLFEEWQHEKNFHPNMCPACKSLTYNLYGTYVYDTLKHCRHITTLCSTCCLEQDEFEIEPKYLV